MKEWNSIDETLFFAIGEEQAAADFYLRLAQETKVPGMQQAFRSFAQEEMAHKAKLEAIRAGGLFVPAPDAADLRIGDYLADVVSSREMTYRNALIVAMKKEKAAFKLYTALAQSVTDETLKKTFKTLAQEEAQHKLRFELEYEEMLAEG